MSKNNLLNLVLLLIAATLASIIYFSNEVDTDLARLTEVDPNTIQQITISHNNNATTIIDKTTDSRWQLSKPIAIVANPFRISSILKLLKAPVHNKYASDAIDLHKTGLLTSKTRISFDDISIIFGTTNPVTNLRFVQLKNTVYTIEDVYYPLLSSHFSTLVSFNLLPANSVIDKLILGNQTIDKKPSGLWQSNSEISADNINIAIENWQTTQAFGVHEYIEREALAEVFVYLENPAQAIRFIITDTDPWLIIARPELGLEYHLEKEAYDKLVAPK